MPSRTGNMGERWVNAITHLRVGFSLMLMPAFLLAAVMSGRLTLEIGWLFGILHLLVYPASNGYNTYFDRDTKEIGGLKAPPPVNRELGWLVQILDLMAIGLTAWRFPQLLGGIIAYQLASRAYSYYRTRLKALPWLSWAMVGMFQGVVVFAMVWRVARPNEALDWRYALVIFLYLVASYPITQVYQIEEDAKRGDRTVAARLGIWGSLVVTGLLFGLYVVLAWWAGLPNMEWLLGFSGVVLAAFAWVVWGYWQRGIIGYEQVRLLILLNWAAVVGYFGVCLGIGTIIFS